MNGNPEVDPQNRTRGYIILVVSVIAFFVGLALAGPWLLLSLFGIIGFIAGVFMAFGDWNKPL